MDFKRLFKAVFIFIGISIGVMLFVIGIDYVISLNPEMMIHLLVATFIFRIVIKYLRIIYESLE